MPPRIGITMPPYPGYQGHKLRDDYPRLVAAAGGLPLLLPASVGLKAAEALPALDGLLLSGGGHFPPQWAGADGHTEPTARDILELELAQGAWERALPILAICRGFQGLNIALGGSLITELRGRGGICHQQKQPRGQPSHEIRLRGGMARLYAADKLLVNSFHTQAVDRLAPPLTPCAWAADGVVEGAEAIEGRFALGVQWHPEALGDITLFQALLQAAAGGRP